MTFSVGAVFHRLSLPAALLQASRLPFRLKPNATPELKIILRSFEAL
jgi:hypothetical protein